MRPLAPFAALLAAVVLASPVAAFVHVVQPGETLAAIADRYYGRVQLERHLVAANSLDLQGGVPMVPGTRLEVPAVGHRIVRKGDSWEALAAELLGSPKRGVTLALANDASPWIAPHEGADLLVPYNLRIVLRDADTLVRIAERFYGDGGKAWLLDGYNGLGGKTPGRGDALLVPLVDLPLTAEGRKAALGSLSRAEGEGEEDLRRAQRSIRAELPALLADVRQGRYVDAVVRGTRFLATPRLPRPARALIHRQLLEAYAALGSFGAAQAACAAWLEAAPDSTLDSTWLSPKLLRACEATRKPK